MERIPRKQKQLFRMRRTAREAAEARLSGKMRLAMVLDDEIERIYRNAKANRWSEDAFVLAEERGREEARHSNRWLGAQSRVRRRKGTSEASRDAGRYRSRTARPKRRRY